MSRALALAAALGACAAALGACAADPAQPGPDPDSVSTPPRAPAGPVDAPPDTVEVSAADVERYAVDVSLYPPADPSVCGAPAVSADVVVYFTCVPDGGPPALAVAAGAVEVRAGERPEKAALRTLLAGPTPEQAARGFTSGYGGRTAGLDAAVTLLPEGLAVVDLPAAAADLSPRPFVVEEDLPQLAATLGQFAGVERVLVRVGGRPFPQAFGDG